MTADLSNWRDPEYNNWSFQNVNKILDTQSIKKGSNISKLGSNPLGVDGFKIDRSDKPSLDLPSFLAGTETDGLILLKDDNIIYEYYGRTNEESSKHIIMSMTKSVTGLICGILVERGQLDLDALVSTYVPEVKETAYRNLTVRQCLDMRAGVQYDDSNPLYRGAAGWAPSESEDTPADLHNFLSSFEAPVTPKVDGLEGAPFEYLSVNTDLMGWVLERITSKKFAELISEMIWQPMGAESDAYIATDKAGNARPAGGMCTTLRDIARVGQLVLRDGDGIVPTSWIHDMLNDGSQDAFNAGLWTSFSRVFGNVAYRSYWLANSESESLIALGVHGQMLLVDRKNGMVMAKTSSQPERADGSKIALTVLAFKEFQRLLKENSKE